MTVFYNPKTKKPHPWVFMAFIAIPFILMVTVIYFGQQRIQKKMEEEKRKNQTDIFEKF